jgi:hypothetical protein
VRAGEHGGVGGHAVPLRQHEQITPRNVASGDADAAAVAHDEGPRARHVPQRLERPLGLVLLHERDAEDEHDEAQQHERLLPVAEEQVDAAARQQEQRHGLGGEGERVGRESSPRGRRDVVGTVGAQALGGLIGGEAFGVGRGLGGHPARCADLSGREPRAQ